MSKNTVFVIGAGASAEVKLPTGNELKEKISSLLDFRFKHLRQESGDYLILDALKQLVYEKDGGNGNIHPYLLEAKFIKEALPMAISIDNFIDTQKGNKKLAICGKLAIVRSILQAEKSSLLYFDRFGINPNIDFNLLNEKWFLPFFQILTENCSKKDLKERFRSIVLIIFNYDRCIEHFFYYALQKYYRITTSEAAEIVNQISIYHPYGNVGSLPWSGNDNILDFGDEPSPKQLIQITTMIKTFTEGTDPNSSEIVEIRNHVKDSQRIVFLGFAFHPLNMDLINPKIGNDEIYTYSKKCFGTSLGLSDSDKEIIEYHLENLFHNRIETKMVNKTCFAFFDEFRRSLSFT